MVWKKVDYIKPDEKEVGRFTDFKGENSEIIVVVREVTFGEKELVDIRKFTTSEKYTGPSKKGIAIRKELVPELIKLLQEVKV